MEIGIKLAWQYQLELYRSTYPAHLLSICIILQLAYTLDIHINIMHVDNMHDNVNVVVDHPYLIMPGQFSCAH